MTNKWLLTLCLSLMMVTYAQAENKIAIVNMNTLFQQIAQKTGIFTTLEKEFKDRANELQHLEGDLQNKMQRLQRNNPPLEINERNKLEKDIMEKRQTLSQKAQSFEQDRQRRSNEEHDKLVAYIQEAVKKVSFDDNIDLVIDTNAVAFNSDNIKNITPDVLKQVK